MSEKMSDVWALSLERTNKTSFPFAFYSLIRNFASEIEDMAKRREIRNSTAEFLIFQIEGKEQGVEVYYKDKTVWCTQKAMGMLFDCSTDNVGLHLKNIFASGELVKDSVTEKISATASDGKNYMTQFYNLDASWTIVAFGKTRPGI